MRSIIFVVSFFLLFLTSCDGGGGNNTNDNAVTGDTDTTTDGDAVTGDELIADDDSLTGDDPATDSDAPQFTIAGFVQKGPFVQGSEITIQELDASLVPIGTSYTTDTIDDFGSFGIARQMASNFIEVTASGFYFNEVVGSLSAAGIQFRVVADIGEAKPVNINILTTIERERIKELIGKGDSFEEARAKAEQEILAIFNITGFETANFQEMDISKEGDSNAILLAISAVLQQGNSEAQLSELISKITQDIKTDGTLDNETQRAKIVEGGIALDLAAVRTNIEDRYTDLGLTDLTIPPFEDFVDSDGDGLINRFDFTAVFAPVTNADLAAVHTSNAITVVLPPAIAEATATVDAGTLVVNGTESGATATVTDGDTIAIRLTAPTTHGETATANLTVSYDPYEVTGAFAVTAKSDKYFALEFTAVSNAELLQTYTSNEQTITLPATIADAAATLDNGVILVNGVAKGASATVVNGDTVAVRLNAPTTHGATATANLTVSYGSDEVSGAYAITARTDKYFTLSFTAKSDADLAQNYTSNEQTVTLPATIADAAATLDHGAIVVNGVAKGASATVVNGDKVAVRLSTVAYDTAVIGTLTINYLGNTVSGAFSVTAPRMLCGTETCADRLIGLVWTKDEVNAGDGWGDARDSCLKLELGGKSDWRLPKVWEFRTIIRGCPADAETGGSCGVIESCLTGNCMSIGSCSCTGGNTVFNEPSYIWAMNQPMQGGFWTGSVVTDDTAKVWAALPANGPAIGMAGKTNPYTHARCVRSDTDVDEEYSDIYTDPVTGLQWTREAAYITGPTTVTHCADLTLEGKDDWRLPTISELRTLVRDCPNLVTDGACGVTDSCLSGMTCLDIPSCYSCGEGSAGTGPDDGYYWEPGVWIYQNDPKNIYLSSSTDPDNGNPWTLDFYNGSIRINPGPATTGDFMIRCVRN
ncbi:MAG TPA: DUF1566 domain-containing protein [bacterium]|nr:DUF1566 domain-containing protein [bacterium]